MEPLWNRLRNHPVGIYIPGWSRPDPYCVRGFFLSIHHRLW